MDASRPTSTYNTIGRHQSKFVGMGALEQVTVAGGYGGGEALTRCRSPSMGRTVPSPPRPWCAALRTTASIDEQADLSGVPTMDTAFAPNGSAWRWVITSPDGRVLGKMGPTAQLSGKSLYCNIPDRYDMKLFVSAGAAILKNLNRG
ncbi:MAG: phosphoribosylformylglycinamidine synthase subunit PurQ [Oscillospiraceae bacterium]